MKPLAAFSIIGVVATFCLTSNTPLRAAEHDDKAHGETWAAVKQAVAVMHPTVGNKCHGVVRFTQEVVSVKVVADIVCLNPGQKLAIDVHQFGECTPSDGISASRHYNPVLHQHGLPD